MESGMKDKLQLLDANLAEILKISAAENERICRKAVAAYSAFTYVAENIENEKRKKKERN